MSVPEGTLFGNYRIARPIGTGGFSTVYLANDDRLDAEVAIKVLAENRALDIDARRRFVEEAQKLRKVKCNEVVAVYDVGETSGQQPYMVLEYADRGDLAYRQQALGQPVPTDGCLQVVDFLHRSLSALHALGLIHRDVKPHNILIRTSHGAPAKNTLLLAGNERLLLGDLGFVKDLNMASGLTAGGGTWAYQAPEQRHRFGTVDGRADIFSATAVIAWLMTGQQPAEGQHWPDLLNHTTVISPIVKTELQKGMAESPDDRHATIDQWRMAIDEALQPPLPATLPTKIMSAPHQEVVPAPVKPEPTFQGHGSESGVNQSVKPSALRRWSLGAAALIIGLAGLAAGWGIWGGDGAEQQIAEDGTATTTVEINGRRVSISGPSEVSVGEQVTFVSEMPADVTGSWVYPDGSVIALGTGVVYTADSQGAFTVTLLVVVPGSEPKLVVHEATAGP